MQRTLLIITAERGEAKLRILDFKITWSEFQKASLTAAERGEAELRILDFKTSWSEFQKPSQTATEQGKVKVCLFNSKTTWRGNGILFGATVWISKTLTMWF